MDPLLDGLVAYYRFEGDLADSSGNNQPFAGAGIFPQFDAGVVGSRLSGWSTDPQRTLPATIELPYSMAFWGWFTGTKTLQVRLMVTGSSRLAVDVGGLTPRVRITTPLTGSPSMSDAVENTPYHVVAVGRASGTVLYVNGALIGTGATAPSSGINIIDFHDNIGTGSCAIDELAVYARELDLADAERLYNGGAGFDPTA